LPKAESSGFCNMNLIQMEITMNFKRAFLILVVLMMLPALAQAQVTARFDVDLLWLDTDLDPGFKTDVRSVTMTCSTGLPLIQSAPVSTGHSVEFVLTSLLSYDDVDCTISQTLGAPSGYTQWHFQLDDLDPPSNEGLGGCDFNPLNAQDDNTYYCNLVNQADFGSFTVYTEWDITGAEGDIPDVDQRVKIACNERFAGALGSGDGPFWTFRDFSGPGLESATIVSLVTRVDGTTECWAYDGIVSSAVDTNQDCTSGNNILPGGTNSCKFDYAVFFEGIPTLSQYGLAIMALLMLGVGFVGFRRFV
jgi:hypothetical protein